MAQAEEVVIHNGGRSPRTPRTLPQLPDWEGKGPTPTHLKTCSGLTGLVVSRVVTEFQHVEVSPLHAAPDAVNPSDVGAFVVHLVQRSHEVIIAVVAKGHRGNQLEEKEVEEDCDQV